MPDSLTLKVNSLSYKIDTISTKINSLSNKGEISLWIPIIVALITVLIGTLIGQAIDRYFKSKNEKLKDCRSAYSKCTNSKIRLKGLFRQLAIAECDSAFWFHIYRSNPKTESHGFGEHLNSEKQARQIQNEIDITIAEFLEGAAIYERINSKKFDISNEKVLIDSLEFRNMDYYPENLDVSILREQSSQDKSQLKIEYMKNLGPFEAIITKMVV